MLALALGTLLAVGALAYVLYPLFVTAAPPRALRSEDVKGREGDAVVALREIEFDRQTGKLSDTDYAELKARYTERALAAMRAEGVAEDPLDAVEAAVAAYRSQLKSCVTCGPRPEPDARYCSGCGTYLAGECVACHVPVTEPGAAYCTSCGSGLALLAS